MNIEQIELRLSRKSSSPMFARLAGEYFARNRIAEARDLCNSGLLNFPTYSTAHLILAKCFASENNNTDSKIHLQQALIFDPNSTSLKIFQAQIDLRLSHDTTIIQEQRQIDSISTVKRDESSEESFEIIAPVSSEESAIPATEEIQDSIPAGIIRTERADETEHYDSTIENLEVTSENELDKIVLESIHSDQVGEVPEVPALIEASSRLPDELFTESTEETSPIVDPQTSTVTEEIFGTEWNRDTTIPIESAELPGHEEGDYPRSNDITELVASETETEDIPESSGQIQLLQSPPQAEDIQPGVLSSEEPDQLTSTQSSGEIIITDDVENRIFSKTLAEIYATQGEYAEAIYTYQNLVRLRPELKHEIEERIKELEKKLQHKTEE